MFKTFNTVAFSLRLNSSQIESVYSLLCIEETTTMSCTTISDWSNDLPQEFREWLQVTDCEGIIFEKRSQEKNVKFYDWDLLEH